MSGYYLMHRGWMDNPVFGGSRQEPYCRRSAWVWLIEHAQYEDATVLIGGKPIELRRGQLSYSYRYLASAWGWSEAKVRRWCVAVASAKMISCVSDAGQAVITICNYEKYQNLPRVADAADGASVTQHRRSTDANTKESKLQEEDSVEASASTAGPPGASVLAPLDAASVLIGRCTAWIAKATGRQEKSLRGWVVGLLKRYGDGAVLDVFTAASRAPPADPVAWIEGALRHREKRNGARRVDPITGWYAGFNEAIGERGGSADSEPDRPPNGTLLGGGYAD